jgi:hypothetical protein
VIGIIGIRTQPPTPNLLTDTLDQQLGSVSDTTDKWFEHFVAACKNGAFPRALAFKSQVTGPLTLAGLLGADGRSTLTPELLASLTEHVARRAVGQARALRALGLPVLIVLDEPALALTSSIGGPVKTLLNAIFSRISEAGAHTGVHCCATTHPGTLGFLDCDVISFDATSDLSLTGDDLEVLDDPRRVIAFGLIGTGLPAEEPGRVFTRWLMEVLSVSDPAALAGRTIVSSRCGLGRSTFAETRAAFEVGASVGGLIARMVAD